MAITRSAYLMQFDGDTAEAKQYRASLTLVGLEQLINKANTASESDIDQNFITYVEALTKWNIARPALNEMIEDEAEAKKWTLTINATGCTVAADPEPSTDGKYADNTSVELTFTPAEAGYTVQSCTVDGVATTVTSDKITVTMTENLTVVVEYGE